MSYRVLTGGTWTVEHTHAFPVGGLIGDGRVSACVEDCLLQAGTHEVRDVWRSNPRPLPTS